MMVVFVFLGAGYTVLWYECWGFVYFLRNDNFQKLVANFYFNRGGLELTQNSLSYMYRYQYGSRSSTTQLSRINMHFDFDVDNHNYDIVAKII